MSDVFDYLAWRGDLSFESVPPNEADRLILCILSFLDFEGIVSHGIGVEGIPLRHVLGQYFEKKQAVNGATQNMRRFAAALMKSKRFGTLTLSGYRAGVSWGAAPDDQLQFAALSARFANHLSVIYRGTDDTLVGWKENFNSDLIRPIPAQAMAAAYLEQAAELGMEMVLQGHSKGGNLAVYAAAASSVPISQIRFVYDYDGPGFERSFFLTDRYGLMRGKIRKFLPEYPVIGLIKESDCHKTVIRSMGKGLSQHNGFHWQFCADGLERAKRADPRAILLNSRLKRCYGSLNSVQRKAFIEGMYRLVSLGGRQTVTELSNSKRMLLRDFKQLDPDERQTLMLVFTEIVKQVLTDTEK